MSEIPNSSKEKHKDLIKEYNRNLMKVEMNLHVARQTRMLNKIQRYFNSTPLKNGFARWMATAYYDNEFYTISRIAKEMKTNRQTISKIVSECEKENYIIVKRIGKTVESKASPLLMKKINDYCNWRHKLTKETIGKSYSELMKYESMMSKKLNT